jgi:carboxypeptidase C (cathepsin A)
MLAALLLSLALFAQGPDAQGGRGQRPGGGQGAQQPTTTTQTTTTQQPGGGQTGQRPQGAPTPNPEEPPTVTHHSITVGGKELRYTATTGMMLIKNRDGETEARMFFTAYTLDGVENRSARPMTFSFNGGPGSASVWLHKGASTASSANESDGRCRRPPYHLIDNQQTWLDQTDLVFIDPVGTGYSRALNPQRLEIFGLQGDIESVGEFIRMYLVRYERWTSPLFLAGESYGTTRASALSGYLIGRGIAFNGSC